MTQSVPSFRRTVVAFSLYAGGGIAAFVWKVLRDRQEFDSYPVSPWLVGVMPNLLPAAVLPALIIIRPQSVRFKEYFSIVVAVLSALIAYEIAQLWMPSRTFDVADIIASILGAGLGCLFCWLIFFAWLGRRCNSGLDPLN